MQKIKIGVLREEKSPPDKRVPLTPLICSELTRKYTNIEIVVQPSKIRCYTDDEYTAFGVSLQEDLTDCDVLMGVKEVPYDKLIPNKKYFFFSHTIKKQPHNKKLMKFGKLFNFKNINNIAIHPKYCFCHKKFWSIDVHKKI